MLVALLIAYRDQVMSIVSDADRLRDWLLTLGPLGPMGLIALNALQVVLAPIPGYFVQIAAGYLFGWLPGAIYGAIGMAIGGMLAMILARVYGRPLVRRIVGAGRLDRWERVTRLNTLGIWFVLMLGPFGDVPYYIAGLTSIAVWKIVAIALLVRGPSVAVAAAVGAGAVSWRSPWVIGGAVALLALGVLGMRYQDQIDQWVDEVVLGRLLNRRARPRGSSAHEVVPDADGGQAGLQSERPPERATGASMAGSAGLEAGGES